MRLQIAIFLLASLTFPSRVVCTQPQQHVLSSHDSPSTSSPSPRRIAIIGAGAAGSSSAFHLSNFSHSASIPVSIDVFERNSYIGGRSTTVDIWGDEKQPIELGGSIFVRANRILWEAAERWGLEMGDPMSVEKLIGNVQGGEIEEGEVEEVDLLSIWNGEEFVFVQTGSSWDYARLVWRYGALTLWRMQSLVKEMISKFLQLYDVKFPFTNLGETAYELGLLPMAATTGGQLLTQRGIGRKFWWEVVQASTRCNYAQNLDIINGLETVVSMAAEGAVAVEGGNWRIFERFLAEGAEKVYLETEITNVARNESTGKFVLSSTGGRTFEGYDEVIIASPYQFTSLNFTGLQHIPDPVPYVTLHVTLFASSRPLSPKAFNLPETKPAPLIILTTLPESENPGQRTPYAGRPGFFSISKLGSYRNPMTQKYENAYKIFSPDPVTPEFLAEKLDVEDVPDSLDGFSIKDVSWLKTKVWQSYPVEYPRVTFEEMKLGDGVWYTGGMDSFVSTMETNALMGMNVARLMVDGWIGEKRNSR